MGSLKSLIVTLLACFILLSEAQYEDKDNYLKESSSMPSNENQEFLPSGPPIPSAEDCPVDAPPVRCTSNPCDEARCPRFSNAKCRLNYCGGCFAEFQMEGRKVDCGETQKKPNEDPMDVLMSMADEFLKFFSPRTMLKVSINDRKAKLCSCVDCLKASFCHFASSDNMEVGIKLMMMQMMKYGYATQQDVDQIKVDVSTQMLSDSCVMNKIAYISSYLFDIDVPAIESECNSGPFCQQDKCYAALKEKEIVYWGRLSGKAMCELNLEFQTKKNSTQLYFDVIKATIMKQIKTRGNESEYDFSSYSDTMKKHQEDCPAQKVFSLYDYIKLTIQLTSEVFTCKRHGPHFFDTYVPPCSKDSMYDDHHQGDYGSFKEDYYDYMADHSGQMNDDYGYDNVYNTDYSFDGFEDEKSSPEYDDGRNPHNGYDNRPYYGGSGGYPYGGDKPPYYGSSGEHRYSGDKGSYYGGSGEHYYSGDKVPYYDSSGGYPYGGNKPPYYGGSGEHPYSGDKGPYYDGSGGYPYGVDKPPYYNGSSEHYYNGDKNMYNGGSGEYHYNGDKTQYYSGDSSSGGQYYSDMVPKYAKMTDSSASGEESRQYYGSSGYTGDYGKVPGPDYGNRDYGKGPGPYYGSGDFGKVPGPDYSNGDYGKGPGPNYGNGDYGKLPGPDYGSGDYGKVPGPDYGNWDYGKGPGPNYGSGDYGKVPGPDYGNGDYGKGPGPNYGNGDYGKVPGPDYGNGDYGKGPGPNHDIGDYGKGPGPDFGSGAYRKGLGPDYGSGDYGKGPGPDFGSGDYRKGPGPDYGSGDYGKGPGPDNGNWDYGKGPGPDFGSGPDENEMSFMDSWRLKPVPLLSLVTHQRMKLLNLINDVVRAYQRTEKKCYDEKEFQVQENCGPYKDDLVLTKYSLINKMQKAVVGCTDCQKDQFTTNENCEMEFLARNVIKEERKREVMQTLYEKYTGCWISDNVCIERNLRNTPAETYHLTYELMRVLVGCQDCRNEVPSTEWCNSYKCVPKLKVAYPANYLYFDDLANVAKTCDVVYNTMFPPGSMYPENMFTPGMYSPEMYPPDMYSTADSEPTETLMTAEPSPMESRQHLIEKIETLQESKLTYKAGEYLFNIFYEPFLNLDDKKDYFCRTEEQLQERRCEPFLRKLQFDVVMHINKKIMNERGVVDEDVTKNSGSECVYNSNHTMIDRNSNHSSNIVLLYNLMFTGCYTSQPQDSFNMAVMQCSYFSLLYHSCRGGHHHLNRIFGETKTLSGFKLLYKKYPMLFQYNCTDKVIDSTVTKMYKAFRCNQRCPIDYKYCGFSRMCLPLWSPCGRQVMRTSMAPKSVTTLPSMYSNESRSIEMRLSMLEEDSIVLVNRRHENKESGVWQYNFDGKWSNLTSLPYETGVKLVSSSKFRYRQYKGQYGSRVLHYYEDRSRVAAGSRVSFQTTVDIKEAIMLIHPRAARVTLTVEKQNMTYRLNEDEYENKGVVLTDIFKMSTSLNRVEEPVHPEYFDLIPQSLFSKFQRDLQNFELYRPYARISPNYKKYGKLALEVYTPHGFERKPVDNDLKLDHTYAKLVFTPRTDYNGNFSVDFEIHDAVENISSPISFSLLVCVRPMNDPPHVRSNRFDFPPIPFNMTNFENNGVSVNEIISATDVKDPESGTQIGIAIFHEYGSSIGTWQIKRNGSSWEDLNFDDTAKVFLTSGDVRIRMNVVRDIVWRFASQRTFISFRFWDKSDGMTEGYRYLSQDEIYKSNAYSGTINGRQLRKGCNNVPDSAKILDKCGVCGGFGRTCRGCDGDPKAKIDQCQQCTGGSTGKKFNFMKDCAGQCGKYERDRCNVCQRKDSRLRRDFTDCSGTCFGRAKLDKCGVCSGGKTGVLEGSTLDICNVCGGDGSSCNGCDIKSGKNLDLCGNCLSTNDASFNAGCFKLFSMVPQTAPAGKEELITLNGTGLASSVVCSLKNEAGDVFAASSEPVSNTQMRIKTRPLSAGTFSLTCISKGQSVELKTQLKVYKADETSVTGVHPMRVPTKSDAKLMMHGKGFVQTGEVECLLLMKSKVTVLSGTYINRTHVECSALPLISKSISASVGLSFTKQLWTSRSAKKLKLFEVKIFAAAPKLLSAKMTDDFRNIALNFSSTAWTTKRGCKEIFSTATNALLGGRSRCYFKGDTILYIRLDTKATIAVGDTITLNKDAIKARFEKIVEYTDETSVVLTGRVLKLNPVAAIEGKSILSSCENLKLSARKSTGGGKKRLSYIWNVTFADADKNSNKANSTLLKMLVNRMSQYSTRSTLVVDPLYLTPELTYNITMHVRNFLKEESGTVYHLVKKVSDALPVLTILGDRVMSIKSSRRSKFMSSAKIPKCMDKSERLTFSWTIEPSIDLDTKSKASSTLYIYPGTLLGNEVYTLKVVVSLKSDISKSVSDEIELHVKSSDLITRISGGRKTVIGFNEDITLDGSKSYDPDKTSEEEWFDWECFDLSTDGPCYVSDPETGEYNILEIDLANKVSVKNGLLESDKTYQFTLNYQKGMRSASSSTQVKILGVRPPKVKVKVQKRAKENVKEAITIRGVVASHIRGTRIWVESVEEVGFAPLDLTQEGLLLTPTELYTTQRIRPVSMVFNKNTLAVGVSYKFRMHAEHNEGAGYAEFTITTNSPPTINMLVSDPSNGTALDTEFTLTALEGYDDDGDLPLTYNFGYINSEGKKQYLGSPSTQNTKSSTLPTGQKEANYKLDVFVEITDALGAKSEYPLSLTVMPPETIDSAAITNAMDSINQALASEDLDSAIGAIVSSLSTFETTAPASLDDLSADEIYNVEETEKKLLEMKESITNNVLTMANTVVDEETQDVVISTMGDMTEGGTSFNDETKVKIVNTISNMVEDQIGVTSSSGGSRRRRSTESNSDLRNGKTPEQVEDLLRIYDNTIDPSNMTSFSMEMKKNFTDLVPVLKIALCQQLAFGRAAVLAKGQLVEIQSVKVVFANISTRAIDLNCGENCTAPAKVVFGNSIESKYSSFACGIENCTGTCIGSVKYNHDLFASDTKTAMMTDIVSLALFDPEQDLELSPGVSKDSVEYRVPLKNESDADYFFVCQMWDDSASKWTTDFCTAMNDTLVSDSTSYAVCKCDRVGTVGVSAGAKRPLPTTPGPTTTPNLSLEPTDVITTESTEQLPKYALVTLTFNDDWDSVMSKINQSQLEEKMKETIVTSLNVPESRVTNVVCRNGSIITTFNLLPDKNYKTEDDFDPEVNKLKSIVDSGLFKVNLGNTLTITASKMTHLLQYEPGEGESGTGSGTPWYKMTFVVVAMAIGGLIVLCAVGAFCYRASQDNRTEEYEMRYL